MKKTAQQFRQWPNKAITLLGMSGVGKTTLSTRLPRESWFHYSGDYRIGTKYLDEPILDDIKTRVMENQSIKELLRSDSIYIRNNITIDHLHPLSCFLSKIGNPDLGGLNVDEFKRRQNLFFAAEINAMADVREFMEKARKIYSYPHFINDAGGSICYLTDQECWNNLNELTVVLYLRASDDMEKTLVERAGKNPKPLFYEENFLDQHLARYLEENNLKSTDEMVPDEFVQWVFPKLINYRKPRYERLAEKYGHTIEAEKIFKLPEDADIIDLVCESMS
ncbi:ATPase [Candidatus Spongiihabitans sp.]|uniref:ATPase n=1 Tax=Candidatus Spongiihabitans sp. TaxID=3101308 RepID=UPI003C6EE122